MSEETNEQQAPQVDESQIRSMAEKLAEQIAAERYQGYEAPEKVKGLKDKNEELLNKYHKYQSLTDEDINRIQQDKERREKDEVYALLSEGKHDEAVAKLTAPRYEAWTSELNGAKEQLEAAQKTLQEREKALEEKQSALLERDKRDYLKGLTSEDDSFKKDYFGDFYQLQSSSIEIDPNTGAAYALKDGKRVVDMEGNHVSFEQHYKKLKTEHGLFWSGGQGAGLRGNGSGEGFTGNPRNWDHSTKMSFIAENGREAYAKLLSKQSKK